MDWSFALDGQTNMMSLNPLEMTNFEMMGTIFGVGGVLLTLVWSRISKSRAGSGKTYDPVETEEDMVEQVP